MRLPNGTPATTAVKIVSNPVVVSIYFPSRVAAGTGDQWGNNLSFDSIFASDHARARAAVYRLLIDPKSATFDAVRTVDVPRASYVCGNVNSKDRAGHRAFVYAVALNVLALPQRVVAKAHTLAAALPAARVNSPLTMIVLR